jgi:acyl-CoA thioester hydrolase
MSDGDWSFTDSDEVRFADLDTQGHLNNVAFLVFFESARVAYARSVMPEHNPGTAGEFGFMVVEAKITYRSPGRYGERIDTRLRPTTVGRSSFRCEFEMRVRDRVLADGYAVMVTYDHLAASSIPVPDLLRARLLADGAQQRSGPARDALAPR